MFRVWVQALSLLAGAALAMGQAAPSKRAAAKVNSTILNINAPGAVILRNELFVGKSGDRIDAAPGQQMYAVSAPGFIPRQIYVNQSAKQALVTVNVMLLPVPGKGEMVELDYKQTKSFPATRKFETLPSLCATFTDAGSTLPRRQALTCDRRTIIDDLRFFGTATIFGSPTAKTEPGIGNLLARLDQALTDDFYWAAESLYAAQPNDDYVANALAYSAMRRQNCSRVMEIAMEHGAAKLTNPGLAMIRGWCLELAGKPDKSIALFQEGVRTAPKPMPDAFYQFGRAASVTNPQLAGKGLQTCSERLPHYYPCFEALAHVRLLNGQNDGARQALDSYHRNAAEAIRAVVGTGSAALDPAKVNAAFQLRPYNLELAVAMHLTGAGSEAQLAQAQLVSDLPSLKVLLTSLDQPSSSKYAVAAYRALTDGYPKDPSYWIRFAHLLSSQNRCAESIKATDRALALVAEPTRRAALIVTRASCLVRVGRLKEAKTSLSALVEAGYDTWQMHYNLGVAHERLGDMAAALAAYQKALLGSPPESVRAGIQQRIEFEQRKLPAARP